MILEIIFVLFILASFFAIIFIIIRKKKDEIKRRQAAVKKHKEEKIKWLIINFINSKERIIYYDADQLNEIHTFHAWIRNYSLELCIDFARKHNNFFNRLSDTQMLIVETYFFERFHQMITIPLHEKLKGKYFDSVERLQEQLKYFEHIENWDKCIEIRDKIKKLKMNEA